MSRANFKQAQINRSGTFHDLRRPVNQYHHVHYANGTMGGSGHPMRGHMTRSKTIQSFVDDDANSVSSFDDAASVVSSMASYIMDAEDVRSSASSTFETLVRAQFA